MATRYCIKHKDAARYMNRQLIVNNNVAWKRTSLNSILPCAGEVRLIVLTAADAWPDAPLCTDL
jgi:hypothetical protein